MGLKVKEVSLEEAREITSKTTKKSGETLLKAVRKMREETIG